jgi:ankyrin repeat protein
MSDDWFQKEQLHFAAADGDLRRVKKLIENGCDVNAFDEYLAHTPLHYAAREEHIEVVDYLISVGAQINAHEEEKIGETPLGEVAASCSYELAQKLISAGANPTIPGWMGITALDRAKKRKKPEGVRVFELLLSMAKNRFHYDA